MHARLDIRMLRDGTRWSAVATIRSSDLKGPIDLYASGDVRDLARAARTGADVARASAATRERVRQRSLAQAKNFFITNPISGAESMTKMLDACSVSIDLVSRARRGDKRAEEEIGKIFIRSSRGDAAAGRSAQMILESAGLVDTGRCTFRVGFTPMLTHRRASARPMLLEGHEPGDEKSKLNKWGFAMGSIGGDASGHEVMSNRRKFPQYGVGFDGTGCADTKCLLCDVRYFALDAHYDPWASNPYPMDTRGSNLLQTFRPVLADH